MNKTLKNETLEKLRLLLNEEIEYRSGRALVSFFNELGFGDTYGSDFPSRKIYTETMLININGSPYLDRCIQKLLSPINFIGRFDELDNYIKDFNQYLVFDNWKIIRNGKEILFLNADDIDFEKFASGIDINEFLISEFDDINIENLGLAENITETINFRIEEIKKCLTAKAPLSVIFLSGSILEGILFGIANIYPIKFNQAKSAPKTKENKVRSFGDWSLNNFINVAYEIGLLNEDVKKHSHSLRDFRNYIHPFVQVTSGFNPDEDTAKLW